MRDRVSALALRWPPRRSVLLAAGLAVAALAYLLLLQSSSRATSDGSPYEVPVAQDTNPSGSILETTLVADEATVDIGNGIDANVQTYNGAIPGPTFDLKVGDTVVVHFQNRLDHATGVHWHGIELPNGVDGTPFTQNMVEPGENFLYKFKVTRPGIFWYHPHHHASTNQVFKGLYGMIRVKDPNEDQLQSSGVLPSDGDTLPIVLSDITVCKNSGSNDLHAYNDNDDTTPGTTAPWAGSGAANTLPHQQGPTPSNLCQGPGVNTGGDLDPYPIDEDGVARGPFSAGDVPNIQTFDHAGRTNEGQTVLTNGKNVGPRGGGPTVEGYVPNRVAEPGASLYNVRPGQGLRLQVLNASAVRYMRLRLTSPNGNIVQLRKVGGEGGLLNEAVTEGGTQGTFNSKYSVGEILLPPGTRTDVVAAIPSAPTTGLLTLWTRDYSRTGLGFSNIATVPVMHLKLAGSAVTPAYTIPAGTDLRNATGDPVETLGAPTGNFLTPGGFTPPKLGSGNQNIQLTQGGTEAGVDGVFGTHDVAGDYKNAAHLSSSRYAKQGDILALSTQNVTNAHHPFHLHGFSIQPLSLDGPGAADYVWPYPEFRDNVDVPGGHTLNFRVRIEPRPMPDATTPGGALGRWVFHCHIFFHATDGMLSELVVTSPTGNERPDINVDNYLLTVRRGRQAQVTGTFGDRDGNPVTLSTSSGTITNTGGGTFSWRIARPRGGDRVVYMTATDSNGLKGQIPMHLNKWPELSRFRVAPKTFNAGGGITRRFAQVSAKKGARIRFKLSEPGTTVTFTAKRIGGGAKATFRRKFTKAGNKKVKFTGKFRGKGELPRGRYKLTAKAKDSTGLTSRKYKTTFRVVS